MDPNDPSLATLCAQLGVPSTYLTQGFEAGIRKRQALFKQLVAHRRMPDQGWDDETIEGVLHDLAMMDSNNFLDNVGVGEREARIYSSLVRRRHFGLGHGMGRSGDVNEPQPKAAGSSLLVKLTNFLALDAVRLAGLTRMQDCVVLPLATGMAMTMTLLTLRRDAEENEKEEEEASRLRSTAPPPYSSPVSEPPLPPSRPHYVIFPRIDQKSCLKAIVTAGLTPLLLPPLLSPPTDELQTNLPLLLSLLQAPPTRGGKKILAILSTTSCFAPRAPDDIVAIARLASQYNVPHIINNAYGLQCSKTMHLINEACRVGRVDAVVQSTDKNFLVPVGGSVVVSPAPRGREGGREGGRGKEEESVGGEVEGREGEEAEAPSEANGKGKGEITTTPRTTNSSSSNNNITPTLPIPPPPPPSSLVTRLCKMYPGRANATPLHDLFITLLSLGRSGYLCLLKERKTLLPLMREGLRTIAEKHGGRLLSTHGNTISFAITLGGLLVREGEEGREEEEEELSFLGAMLFTRGVSGTRVVIPARSSSLPSSSSKMKKVAGLLFAGYGSHSDERYPPGAYLTAACALGVRKEEVEEFLKRLDRAMGDFRKKREKERMRKMKEEEQKEEKKEEEEEAEEGETL